MRSPATTALLAVCLISGIAEAKKPPRGAWDVIRTTDPITGTSTCVVAALDYVGKDSFSRVGALYPLVENNPVHGLLVGVSSGGKFRFPTGDIVWRVDDRPFRELKAQNNPGAAAQPAKAAATAADKAMQDVLALTTSLTASMTSTTTVASGDGAKAMLDEMLAGKALIFRAAAIRVDYGLQSSAMYRVGQITEKGLRPIPLDQSFRDGVQSCGIAIAERK